MSWDWIEALSRLRKSGKAAVLVTLTRHRGSTPRESGAKMLVFADKSIEGSIGGGQLEYTVIKDALSCLETGQTRYERYPLGATFGQCCGGTQEVFMEPVNTTPTLTVFGGGHVGMALAKMMAMTEFRVQLHDQRPNWFDSEGRPHSVDCCDDEWDIFIEQSSWSAQHSYVAIMTHSHDLDQQILTKMLDRPLRYLGLIGSKSKWDRFQQRIGQKHPDLDLERVYCPIGLDVGGKTPVDISISVAAQLLQICHGR